jgi:hypothetical protein
MNWEGELTVLVVLLQGRGVWSYLELLHCPAQHITGDLQLYHVWLLLLLSAPLIFAI